MQCKTHFIFLIISTAASALSSQSLKWFDQGFSLSKPRLSESCSAVIGLVAQSVVIGRPHTGHV